MYGYQVFWFGVGIALMILLGASTGSAVVGLFFGALAWVQIIWIEYRSRCEDRKKVLAVGATMTAVGLALSAHAHHENKKMGPR